MAKKKRLDELLMERGFIDSIESASKIIIAGNVLVNGQKAISPAQTFDTQTHIEIRGKAQFVGRGGEKLSHALKTFHISIEGTTCLDIGSATGGFVDVLLQNGAKKVYAVDTAKGKLDLKLREDSRVVVMESTNILSLDKLPELVDLISIDVSLISLKMVFPKLIRFLKNDAEVIALFKPQYEVADKSNLRHGILEDDIIREKTLQEFLEWLSVHGWKLLNHTPSPIKGSEGNTEYLIHIKQL